METSLLPLPRWEKLEALKKEKEMQLAHTTDVCSFLQECGDTQVQLQGMILQLEALELGRLEGSHRTLQLAPQKMLMLERSIHHLQSLAIKYGLGLAQCWCPGRQGRPEQGYEEGDRSWGRGRWIGCAV